MKLAEALILRADAQRRLAQLNARLNQSAKVQEGTTPPENPVDLLTEYQTTLETWLSLVQRINRTNAAALFDGTRTITDAIAERDATIMQRDMLANLIRAASVQDFRQTRTEIKIVRTIDTTALQKQVDDLAKRYREIDTALQQLNWSVDLVD